MTELSKKTKIIFHFFENQGYETYSQLLSKARQEFPQMIDEKAVYAFYKRERKIIAEESAKRTSKYYEDNPQAINVLNGQVVV
ncbi:MAG: hypothetical protein H6618_05010 [Deltaproteobacteria bacterium]|nr:hypothetical protein [Deltaproteobacteria bacterium]